MDYRLENLSEDDFERLVNVLCERILGSGVVSFSKGKDGGRDGRFEGVANKYPSESKSWRGKFIIQAKHTSDYQASCSDKPFFGNQESIINGEILKIKKLKANNEIDNYLLFTNRKETESREKAREYIKQETKIDNVDIIGKETLHNWLSQYRDIIKQFELNKFTMPFEFYDKDIKEIIIIFYNTLPKIKTLGSLVLERPHIEHKNKINSLDSAYFENIILDDLNRYRNKILEFLENPINSEYAQFYEDTTIELKRIIESHREEFKDFKEIFTFLAKYLTDKEPEKLKRYRNIIPAFFHFMYYQCDIGREK
jgi:hypothetical protein